METLEILVATRQEAEELKEELKRRPQVKAVAVRTKRAASIEKSRVMRKRGAVDSVTLASEASLAERWSSPEDARWDDLLR